MKKGLLILGAALILTLDSCTKVEFSNRNPSSVSQGKIDLIEVTKVIQNDILNGKYSSTNCFSSLQELEVKLKKITPGDLDSTQLEVDGKFALDALFTTRVKLHNLLPSFDNECKTKLKSIFLSMREVEDLVGIFYYKDTQISADSINYKEEKTPVYDSAAYRPYHIGPNISQSGKFEFKNGDIMITKGVSFVSSTISEIAKPRSLFSHIVFVYVDAVTKEVSTIESYVGKGVEIYPIEEALKNENARILILRAKDSTLASEAANYMYNRVQKLKAVKKFIPYDYNLDFSENTKLSCEEVAYDAFKQVSNNTFIIPEVMSEISLLDDGFLNRIGIKKGAMMVPSDMETDSRFEIVLDWTDYRVMRDSWRKDAVLSEIFSWSDKYNYSIRENFTSIAARVVWSTRYIPGLWNMMSRVSGLPQDFTKDVPTKTIATMASLKSIGSLLLPEVAKVDQDYHELTGSWLGANDLRKVLNSYRETHPKKLEKLYRPKK